MNNWNRKLEISDDPRPWFSFISIIFFLVLGYIVFQAAGVLLVGLLYGIDFSQFSEMVQKPGEFPQVKMPLIIVQAITQVGAFIITPLFYLRFIDNRKLSSLSRSSRFPAVIALVVLLIVITFMVFNGYIIKWNQSVDFPAFMDGFEQWAAKSEAELKEITQLLTTFDTPMEFFLAFIVVAVLAAVGEELIFRGLMQNKLFAATKNIHVAIWVTGFIFSAIHLQFFGFVPRMLLGVLFGYLYFWSGNILVPMFAHFVNNGFTIIGLYLYQLKLVDQNIEETPEIPLSSAIISLLVTIALVYYFWRYYRSKETETTL